MEVKVCTIKLNPPRWLRNLIVYVALPVGALVGAAVAVRAGGTLIPFVAGTPIKADDVNANFILLNDAISGLAPANTVPKVTAWAAYTPKLVNSDDDTPITTGVAHMSGMYRRIGDAIEVRIYTDFDASPGTSARLGWSLPPGLTADATKLPGRSMGQSFRYRDVLGVANYSDATSAANATGVVGNGTTTNNVIVTLNGRTDSLFGSSGGISSAVVELSFSVPVTP